MHQKKEDATEIVYPCQTAQKANGASRRDAVIGELKKFVNTEIVAGKSSVKKKVGKKRSKRTQESGDRGMFIVFLDEIDNLISNKVSHILLFRDVCIWLL